MVTYWVNSEEPVVLGRLDSPIRDALGDGEHALYGTIYRDNFGKRVVKYSVIHHPGLHCGGSCAPEKEFCARYSKLADLAVQFCEGLKTKHIDCSHESAADLKECLVRKVGYDNRLFESQDKVLRSMNLFGEMELTQFIPGDSEREIFYKKCGEICPERIRRI